MLVLSAGMPKAGSRWCYNLTNDLLVAAGHEDARALRDRLGLRDILKAANCNLTRLDEKRLARLDEVVQAGRTFAVKTHRGPSRALRRRVAAGRCKVTYIYRDLRDVIVSALDSSRQMHADGKAERYFGIGPYRSFAKFRTVPGAIRWVRWRVLPVWRAYMSWPAVHALRYEDLLADAPGEVQRLAEFLGLDVDRQRLLQIVETYQAERVRRAPPTGIRVNQGVSGRYRRTLSPKDQALCRKRLGAALLAMGYEA